MCLKSRPLLLAVCSVSLLLGGACAVEPATELAMPPDDADSAGGSGSAGTATNGVAGTSPGGMVSSGGIGGSAPVSHAGTAPVTQAGAGSGGSNASAGT